MRLFLLVLWAALACGASPSWYFLQFSDPQFGMYEENRGFVQETANFEYAIATANRLHPAFVVVTGDLINQPGDAAEAAEYRRIAAKLDPGIPLYNVPGNHDVGNDPTPATLAAYRQRFGPDYYTFRAADLMGFVLNSSLIGHPAKAPEEAARQEAWLGAELEKARRPGIGRPVVFQHHPWFLKAPDEADEYSNIPKEIRARYLALLHQYGVRWVFAGHCHRNEQSSDGTLEIVATGPVGKPLGGARSGFRVVTVGPEGISHHYYDFGDIPNRLPPQ
ncbi:MAG TPA: metallophosphoesterase [Bryobacteraceae bacterium]|nr:metallophosphoesterase [Bryobacteraceae bacterium]